MKISEVTFREQNWLEPHPIWYLLGVSFENFDEHPRQLYTGVPLPPHPPPRVIQQPLSSYRDLSDSPIELVPSMNKNGTNGGENE